MKDDTEEFYDGLRCRTCYEADERRDEQREAVRRRAEAQDRLIAAGIIGPLEGADE